MGWLKSDLQITYARNGMSNRNRAVDPDVSYDYLPKRGQRHRQDSEECGLGGLTSTSILASSLVGLPTGF